jgi:hypothetical protein
MTRWLAFPCITHDGRVLLLRAFSSSLPLILSLAPKRGTPFLPRMNDGGFQAILDVNLQYHSSDSISYSTNTNKYLQQSISFHYSPQKTRLATCQSTIQAALYSNPYTPSVYTPPLCIRPYITPSITTPGIDVCTINRDVPLTRYIHLLLDPLLLVHTVILGIVVGVRGLAQSDWQTGRGIDGIGDWPMVGDNRANDGSIMADHLRRMMGDKGQSGLTDLIPTRGLVRWTSFLRLDSVPV